MWKMSGIYTWDLKFIIFIMAAGVGIWSVLSAVFQKKRWWFVVNLFLAMISVYGILHYTVMGRIPSGVHEFALLLPFSDEFWRELLMNVFLFFPLGLSLGNVIKSYLNTILMGVAASVLIEAWQYAAGTGLAQGTDVFCNSFGVAVGAMSFVLAKYVPHN